MKLQIDTSKKTIKLEESVKLDSLIKTLKQLFPNNEWKQFTLETNTVINNWNRPVVIELIKTYPTYPRYPWYDWSSGGHSGYSSSSTMPKTDKPMLLSGQYNVECK